jgi:hypothetical protein
MKTDDVKKLIEKVPDDYGYVFLSSTTPGRFNYMFNDKGIQLNVIDVDMVESFDSLLYLFRDGKPLKYIDTIEKLGTCIDDKKDKEMKEFIVQLQKIYKDLESNRKNKQQFFENEFNNIKTQSRNYLRILSPDKFSGNEYPKRCGDLFNKIKGSYDNINNLQ